MKKKIRILIVGFLIVFLLGELIGRYFGLHDYPTHVSSSKFEYIYAPNQERLIYRNKFSTNEFSMRSKPFTNKDTSVVLLIGDSVINGGNLTDQDCLGSTILENSLTKTFEKPVRVLNISGGSWGPDNAAEYVKQYGLFDADIVVLVVSSHDAYDNMTNAKIVDNHPQFFSRNYYLAWGKLIERGWQQIERWVLKRNNQQKVKNSDLGISQSSNFNSGFDYFRKISSQYNIPFVIYLHPSFKEFKDQSMSDLGREIIEYSEINQIDIIQEIKTPLEGKHYRDGIHYSEIGQKHLAKTLFPKITNLIEEYGTQQSIY